MIKAYFSLIFVLSKSFQKKHSRKDIFFERTILLISLFTAFGGTAFGQNLLTPKEVIALTLENNYDIRVATNDVQIAQNNTTKELNSFLPTVNAVVGPNARIGGSKQTFSNGGENTTSNAFNWGTTANLNADYRIIDKTREMTVRQLEEIVELSDLQLRQTVETNLLQVFNLYYQIAQLTQNAQVFEETVAVSKQRLKRVQYQYDYGQGLRLDVLNAEVDIQRDSINLINLQNQLTNAKRDLNVLMGRAVDLPILPDTTVFYRADLNRTQLIADAKAKNIRVQLINQNLDISALDFDVIESTQKPTLGVSAGYTFSFSDNAPGSFITISNSRGFSGNVTLNWNIYDGGRRKMQTQNARINVDNQLVQKEQILQQIERDVANTWQSYQNALFILRAEQQNVATNELNFQRTEEQFKIGQITSVEFRQAQLNLLNAQLNLNTARYDAKLIEVNLMQLGGRLLEL
ncbi:MAG: TolC family protein [Bacteroidota bacterium]